MVASAEGTVIAASWYGKVKTVLQIAAIMLFIVKDSAFFQQYSAAVQLWVQICAWTVMGAAVIITIMSMVDYFISAKDVLVGPWTGALSTAAAQMALDGESADETDETTG